MADLSLGPLRIANPDETSPERVLQPQAQNMALPSDWPLSNKLDAQHDYLSGPIRGSQSPVSPLPTPPQEAAQSAGAAPPAVQSSAPMLPSYQQRPPDRPRAQLSMAATYQDQQQAQFPQYPSMMPQKLHDQRSPGTRPTSMYYTQVPVNGGSSNGMSRQSSYRMRSTDPAQAAAIPHRSTSKRVVLGDQPGVPSRDEAHSMGSTRVAKTSSANAASSTTPMTSQTVLSTSPYNVEGGPMASSEEWQERGAATSTQRGFDAEGKPVVRSVKKGVKDFNFGQTLGEGSYSTVLAAQDRQTHKDYAVKVLDKCHIIKEKKVKYVNIERDTLNRLTDHPGVVRLYYTFQDERSLYFVLDLCTGGELLGVLKRMGTFDEEGTQFYGAQILDTIEYMHSRGVIHRDLKPENVLLDDNKHIKITDFGTAKLLGQTKDVSGRTTFEQDSSSTDNRASSFVGTAEYVSPELLTDKNACKASDLWAFGCIIYQLLAGRPPFKAANEYLTFQKIVALEYDFPRGFPDVARDLVERLLVLDPQRRLTIEHIKNHAFFDGIKWGKGLWSQPAPRLRPFIPHHSTNPTMLPPSNPKPAPRVITELPPPSQLDIEWSPVLTRNNERILKLGNLQVSVSQQSGSPNQGGKLSRFFGGGDKKKKEMLVMVTSSGRLLIAPAGGDDKRAKHDIQLLSPGTEYSSATDAKGFTHWTVDTRDRHFVFEDVKANAKEPMATAASAQEWADSLVKARDLAISQQERTPPLYSGGDDSLNISSSALSSQPSTIDQPADLTPPTGGHSHSQAGRSVLHKQQSGGDAESLKGRKRFSKRQSKSGLTAASASASVGIASYAWVSGDWPRGVQDLHEALHTAGGDLHPTSPLPPRRARHVVAQPEWRSSHTSRVEPIDRFARPFGSVDDAPGSREEIDYESDRFTIGIRHAASHSNGVARGSHCRRRTARSFRLLASHHGGSSHAPQNEFPFFAQTGDVEIVIECEGQERRYLLHRLILAQFSGFFAAGMSDEWSRAHPGPVPTTAARPEQALSVIGEEGSQVSQNQGQRPSAAVDQHVSLAVPAATRRRRWRYELDWSDLEDEDDEPILVQKDPSPGGIFASSIQPPPPPGPPRAHHPQSSQSFFRSMANLTLGHHGAHSQSTAQLAQQPSPAAVLPLIRDYDNLFRIFYNFSPNLSTTNIASAYSECKALLSIADMYDALPVVGSRIDHHLLRFGSRLFKQIAKYPPSYLKLGYLARSRIIFSEALIHVVGQWPLAYPYLQTTEPPPSPPAAGGGGGGYEVPQSVIDLIEDKVDELEELKAKVEARLFRITLSSSRGERVNPANDYLGWLAMSLFRQWLAENTTPEVRGILKNSPTYLAHDELKRFLKCHPAGGSSSATLYSRDTLKRFERRMDQVKNVARDLVKPLTRNCLELDLRLLADGEGGGLGYLTCVRVEDEDIPWI
ncbi:hypothetical protein DV737_g4469, partial [Chaetothyriales sp. CBS 132003]